MLFSLTLCAASFEARAIELFGKTFFEGKSEEQGEAGVPDPTRYAVSFSVLDPQAGSTGGLARELEATSQLVARKDNPPSGMIGLLSRARTDRNLLLAALYAAGRYGGTVDITIAGQALDDVALDADRRLPQPVAVGVTVRPGPEFHFGSVVITLVGGGTEDPGAYDLSPGGVARSDLILEAGTQLVRAFQERGHPFARIAEQDVVADHRQRVLDVTLVVAPGTIATFGPVRVEGTEKVEADFVVRHADVPVGRTYDPRRLERSAARLRKLGIFSRVTVDAVGEPAADGSVPVVITVSEGKMRVIGAGLTVDSEDGLGVEGFWRHRNLFGRGEKFGVEASLGRIGNVTGLDQLEYRAGLTFAKPGILGPASRFESSLTFEFENPDAFKRASLGSKAGLVYELDDRQTVRGGLEVEFSDIDDAFGREKHILFGVPFGYILDARDDRLDPARGYRLVAFAEPLVDLKQSVGFVRTGGTLSAYRAVDADKRFILAAKLGGGAIFGADLADIAANRRFYAGGANSVRGYGYQQAGPSSADGTPTGGVYWLESSIEARIRVTETIGVVPFFDAGGVFGNSNSGVGDDLQFGAGLGLRYKTAIGPLRLDVALPLNPGRGDDEFGIYLGLGHAF